MIPWWKRINFLIKHQLYLRILPVVVASVLAVGLFSGRLLTSRAVDTYLDQKTDEQEATLSEILGRITIKALAAEAHRDDGNWDRLSGSPAGDGQTRDLLAALMKLEGVCGVLLTPPSGTGSEGSPEIALSAVLDSPANRLALARWVEKQWPAKVRISPDGHGLAWPRGPRLVRVDDLHSLLVFDPLDLTVEPQVSPSWVTEKAPAEWRPVLPVVVHEEAPPGVAAGRKGSRAAEKPHVSILLDVEHLVAGTFLAEGVPGDVGLLLDAGGRLLATSVDTLEVGYDLTTAGREDFQGVPGPELGAFLLRPEEGTFHARLGRKWNPYVFMLAKRAELPLLVVSSLPLSQIHGGLVLYTAIVVLMATIAFLGSILAITTVGETLSRRMQAMSHNMEEVAKGDYSRRMTVGKEDEVGRLVSYFNLMTAGLGEAHGELREKTQRLRIALARMKRLDKAKDDFLALISHEVRTPLTSIMGGVEFFKMVLPQATEEQRQLLKQLNLLEITEIIESSGQRLSEFMNDAILMTALQSSDTKVSFGPVPMVDICALVLSGLQREIAAKSLVVQNELAQGEVWCALCDRDLMVTALEKLIRNAAQHNHVGGRVRIAEVAEVPGLGGVRELLPAKIRRELAQRPSFARWEGLGIRWRLVLIYNTGDVIPEEKRDTLFRKFELVGRIEHHQKGSGLSLPIVQAVLENHGGKIFVQSRQDDGNYFYLLIPALETSDVLAAPSGEEQGDGLGDVSGDEEPDLAGHGAGLEVELEHVGP